MNLYRYVGNDPVGWVDPEGLASFIGGGLNITGHIGPAGASGHAGMVYGLTDNKVCFYVSGCLRTGPGLFAGGGYEVVGGAGTCPTTKGQLEGTSYGPGFDAGLLEATGASGSLSGNRSGISGGSGHGGAGLGASAGIDTCNTKAICF